MDDFDNPVSPALLRIMRIIAGAMIAGATFALVLFVFLVNVQNHGQGLASEPVPFISYILVSFLAVVTAASIFVPDLLIRQKLRQIASGKQPSAPGGMDVVSQLRGLPATWLIIGLALQEGAALEGSLAYLLEGRLFALVAAGLVILLMLLRFPTEYRVNSWMRRQLEWLEQAREQAKPPDAA